MRPRLQSVLMLLAPLLLTAWAGADSITVFDINRAGNLVPLTPSTVVELTSSLGDGIAFFQSTLPANWTRGEEFTVAISFDGLTFGASGNAYMPSYIEFGCLLPGNSVNGVFLKTITQEYPATVTVSFANGGSATEQFIIAPVPEPETWVLSVIGFLGLVIVYWAKQKKELAR